MSRSNGEPQSRIAEVKAAAEDVLRFAAGQELAESDLFPYGVNRISLQIRAGDVELNLEISGPDHAHDHEHEEDAEDWMLEGDDLDEVDE